MPPPLGFAVMTKVVCSPFPALLGVYFSWHCMVAVGSSYYHLLPWACYRTIRVGRTRMASDRDALALVGWPPSRGASCRCRAPPDPYPPGMQGWPRKSGSCSRSGWGRQEGFRCCRRCRVNKFGSRSSAPVGSRPFVPGKQSSLLKQLL